MREMSPAAKEACAALKTLGVLYERHRRPETRAQIKELALAVTRRFGSRHGAVIISEAVIEVLEADI